MPRKSKANAKFVVEIVPLSSLKPHPRNYRGHPDDQVKHLVASLNRFGVYRNIVVAKDSTILAGHGVAESAKRAGMKNVPVVRLNIPPNSTSAIKVLVGDNEIEGMAEQNDRLLADLLKDLKMKDEDKLLGTGFDDMMLANFLMVTRNASEVAGIDEAAHWVGMPEYKVPKKTVFLTVMFTSDKSRAKFVAKTPLIAKHMRKTKATWTTWWPPRPKDDPGSVRVVQAK